MYQRLALRYLLIFNVSADIVKVLKIFDICAQVILHKEKQT